MKNINYIIQEIRRLDAYLQAMKKVYKNEGLLQDLQNLTMHVNNLKEIADDVLSTDWYSVEDRPLFTKDERGYWVCTEDGEGEFIAALKTNKGWWIRHCVVEDETGLCVVGDDYNEPAGWNLEDVTHWRPMWSPPACL